MKIRLLISVVVLGIGSVASASELVSNGGFETGDFTSWSGTAPGDYYNGVYGNFGGVLPFEGNKQAYFNTSTSETLTQTLATTVNGTETISFALANFYGNSTDSFEAYFGGNLLATISNTTNKTYITYSYTATATSTSTDLSFVIANPSGEYWLLDAVSVTETAPPPAVPEPSTLALACVAGVSGLGHAYFRRRKAKLAV